MNKLILSIFVVILITLSSCIGCDNNSSSQYDDEYWESVNKEQSLKDAGYTNAANQEKESRINKLKTGSESNGKYTSTNGEKQTQYQGSKEQKKDLEEIDENAKEHPGF